MQELRILARKLLEENQVRAIVGYEAYRRGVRPAFVTDLRQCDSLVFDHRCVHNLAVYLSPGRTHVVSLGRLAVVIKGCDARSIAGLIRENQLKREDVVLIGVRCGGVVTDPCNPGDLNSRNLAQRCVRCNCREPGIADYLVGEIGPAPKAVNSRDARLAEMESMSVADRLTLWTDLLSRCTRCYACRQVCPMCYCERCITDKTEPAWIESSAHPRGNYAWHITRAMHLAGRCVDCGECERACPSQIPLGFLNRKVARIVQDRYGYTVTDDPLQQTPMGSFRLDDGGEFIA